MPFCQKQYFPVTKDPLVENNGIYCLISYGHWLITGQMALTIFPTRHSINSYHKLRQSVKKTKQFVFSPKIGFKQIF